MVVTLHRRATKVLGIKCPACYQWVKPRRWDRAVGVCFACSASPDRPALFDLACDTATFPQLTGAIRRTGAEGG
jgi:hypothetical protein